MMVFRNKFIVHLGKEGPSPTLPALYHIQGTNDWNTRAIQVKCDASFLNTHGTFILKTPAQLYIWNGACTTTDEKELAKKFGVGSKVPLTMMEEGSEPDAFWNSLGGKRAYPLKKHGERKLARLFECSVGSGIVKVNEIVDFTQDDLQTQDVYILDAFYEVYVWIGKLSDIKERTSAMETAIEYMKLAPDSRSKNTSAVYTVREGQEPLAFTW